MTAFSLSLDSLRSSAHLLHTSITLPSSYVPKNPLCKDYMDHKLILWQELFREFQLHGTQVLQRQGFQGGFVPLHGHLAVGSLLLPISSLLT